MTEANKQKTDIKDTKEALKLGFSIIGAIKAAKEDDGKVNAMDIGKLMMVFPHVGPAIDGADTIGAEMKDLDSSEAKELMVFAAAEIGGALSDAELVEKIKLSLEAVVALFKAVKAW